MDSEEDIFEWICFECHIPAVDPQHLTDQWIERKRTLLFDLDGTIWVRCYCMRNFHLHCCQNLPSDATEKQLEFEHYIYDYCEWYIP